ncbi:AAA ATPase domain-containing protein [Lentzea waywayandensis]|uniref:AAA ATPase domain-containing protein n=1 Tax=Lentzea waywayandensis TaxID=84724 RepID=A0A1I6FGL5_9PSEU|nr:CHAT domain-containing protein [Lentzea waywayandensis]SFR29083.1 AAA ATPase domain-containing protein [Lentzea waywayandensis]
MTGGSKADAVIVVTGTGPYQAELFAEDNGVRGLLAEWSLPADLAGQDVPAVIAGGAVTKAIQDFVATHPSSAEFVNIGKYLGRLLLPEGAPREEWQKLGATRTRLEIAAPELRRIPWEMTRFGPGPALFLTGQHTGVRTSEYSAGPSDWSLPVRLLVVEGEPDEGIKTTAEIRGIKSALAAAGGWVEAEFLSVPTAEELRVAYQRFAPHIFHFIGHCEKVVGSEESALKVRRSAQPWEIRASAIADLLVPAPRLAVLNACRTSKAVEDVDALTEAFVHSGSVAVVGMQGDILGPEAALFGCELYRGLIEGAGIDAAVAGARMRLYTHSGVTGSRDWFLPSLTLHSAPCDVLPEIRVKECQQKAELIKAFVDRVEERHKLVNGVDPERETQAEQLLLITGDREAGKTSLVTWLRRRCLIRGRRVKYVDFNGTDNVDFLSALYNIRDTAEERPREHPDGQAPFDRFNHDLESFKDGRLPVEQEGTLVTITPAPTPQLSDRAAVGLVENLFQSFRNALNVDGAEDPVVLILDHVEQVFSSDFRSQLLPNLLLAALNGDVPGVRLVVVLRADKLDEYWPHDRGGLRVDLDDFDRSMVGSLAEDIFIALGQEIPEGFDKFFDKLLPVGPVKPVQLNIVARLAQMKVS